MALEPNWLEVAAIPSNLQEDDTYLYWFGSGGPVARVRRDGTELNEALTSVPTDNLLGADGTYLYYLNETPSFFIGRMLRDGTAHEDEWLDTEGTDAIGDVVITATHIYWTNLEGERIGRAKIDGTEIEPAWLAAEGKPIGLATDGTYLYWGHRAGEGEYMARVKLDGSGLDTTFAKTGSLFKIAVGTYHLFWAPYGSEGVGRCTIDGGDIEPAWIPPAGSEAGGVAIDSEFFYWAQESEPGFIGRMSRAEADPPVTRTGRRRARRPGQPVHLPGVGPAGHGAAGPAALCGGELRRGSQPARSVAGPPADWRSARAGARLPALVRDWTHSIVRRLQRRARMGRHHLDSPLQREPAGARDRRDGVRLLLRPAPSG
jgi:hypothetical protein